MPDSQTPEQSRADLSTDLDQLDSKIVSALERVVGELSQEIEDRVRQSTRRLAREVAEAQGVERESQRQGALNEAVSALGRLHAAEGQEQILHTLLSETQRFAARAAFWTVHPEGLRGWGGQGFGAEGDERIPGLALNSESVWGAARERAGALTLDAEGCAAFVAKLEGANSSRGLVVPLTLAGQLAGLLYADGGEDGAVLEAAGLQLLTHGAAEALEGLAFRSGQRAPALAWSEDGGGEPLELWFEQKAEEAGLPDEATSEEEALVEEAPSEEPAEEETASDSAPSATDVALAAAAGTAALLGAASLADPTAPAESDSSLGDVPDLTAEPAEHHAVEAPEAVASPAEDVGDDVAAEESAPKEAAPEEAAPEETLAEGPAPELLGTAEIADPVGFETADNVAVEPSPASSPEPTEPELAFEAVDTELGVEETGELAATAPMSAVRDQDEVVDDLLGTHQVAPEQSEAVAASQPAEPEAAALADETEISSSPAPDDSPMETIFARPSPFPAASAAEPAAATDIPTPAEPASPVASEPSVAETVFAQPSPFPATEPELEAPAPERPAPTLSPPSQPTVRLDLSSMTPAGVGGTPAEPAPPKAPEPASPWSLAGSSEDKTEPRISAPTPAPPAPPAVEPAEAPERESRFLDSSEDPTVLSSRALGSEPAPAPATAAPSFSSPPSFAPPEPKPAAPGGTQVRPPEDLDGPGLAFLSPGAMPAEGEKPLHDQAKRLARLLVSEIKLYNDNTIAEGRRSGNIYERLREDIDRSRQLYEERVDARVREKNDYFRQELVDLLAGGDEKLLGMP